MGGLGFFNQELDLNQFTVEGKFFDKIISSQYKLGRFICFTYQRHLLVAFVKHAAKLFVALAVLTGQPCSALLTKYNSVFEPLLNISIQNKT